MDLVPRNVGHESRNILVEVNQRKLSILYARSKVLPASSVWSKFSGSVSAALLALGLSGCQSFSVPFSQWRAGYDSGLASKITKEEKENSASEKVEQPRTLLERWLSPRGSEDTSVGGAAGVPKADSPSTLVLGSDGWRPMLKPKTNPAADKELDEALKLFQQGKLADAEPAFKRIAKNRKGSHWGEKAQYYLAETQYQQKKYVYANDNFEKLFADYPGTEFLDKLVSREYSLAQLWLAQGDPKAKPEQRLAWYTHFTGEQPLIDTMGTGLKALEHVRHHDPTGPLSDDAVLQIADHHMNNGDYESAAIYYDQLVSDPAHSKSPFLQKAQLAAIDARIKGYMGPDYDGAGLEKARELIRQSMTMFPDRQVDEKLYHTLDLINDQDAERTYKRGEYYKKVGKVTSAEYYFGKIPQRWPNSPWAVKAKTELAGLAKLPRKPSVPSKIMSQPGANDPYYSAGAAGAMGGMGGMGMGGMGGMGMMPGGMM
jgi:outer membrane protein assembly factor BamD (BamD/ComL family)